MKRNTHIITHSLAIASLGLLLLLACVQAADAQEKPVVRLLFFYNEDCPVCKRIKGEYMLTVFEKYSERVECRYIEIWNDPENHRTMRGLLLKLGMPANRQDYVPIVVIGDDVLAGDEITEHLEEIIDQYLAQGGVDYPPLDDLPLPVHIAVFYDPDDASFSRLDKLIGVQMAQHGAWLQTHTADISQPGTAELLAQYSAALGLPAPSPGTPHVLVGQQMLVGIDQIESQLPGLIEEYRTQGGVEIPTMESLSGASTRKPIYLAYFEKAGCQKCARTHLLKK